MFEHYLKIDCYDALVGVKKSRMWRIFFDLTEQQTLFIKKT